MRIYHLGLALVIPALVLSAGTTKSRKHSAGPIKSAKEAKAIAEQDTGGKAVSAKRIPLNGASGGWEVDVRMPKESQGYRCIIDSDTRMVHSKSRIDQPGAKGMVVLTGDVGAVRSAVAAGVAAITREGMLIAEVVIPFADPALLKALTS